MTLGARILVVDDDLDMLHLIGLRLTSAGYQVTEASSGEAALVRFREKRPQLVITDLRMGAMDGLALFDHLQAEAPTIPVIILTAHGTIPDAVSATRRGVFSFLTKPFEGQELMRRVIDAIRVSPLSLRLCVTASGSPVPCAGRLSQSRQITIALCCGLPPSVSRIGAGAYGIGP